MENSDNTIEEIHNLLKEELQNLNSIIVSHLYTGEKLIESISSYLISAGGKRIRPLLTILSGKIFDSKNTATLKLAAAVELIHVATLLHDDVVDGSEFRRFKPTANNVWGNKASILVGDFLFSQSFKLMVSSGSLKALASLSSASAIIIEGEVMQLAKLKKMLNIEEYNLIIQAKTAELFGVACEVGAIITNQNDQDCAQIRKFGATLGTIFQITDDILDYFGDAKKTGKNIGNDLLEGKVTLPLIMLNEKLPSNKRQILTEILLKSDRTQQDFDLVYNMLVSEGIDQELKSYLSSLSNLAKDSLQKITGDSIYKQHMYNLINFAVDRTF